MAETSRCNEEGRATNGSTGRVTFDNSRGVVGATLRPERKVVMEATAREALRRRAELFSKCCA